MSIHDIYIGRCFVVVEFVDDHAALEGIIVKRLALKKRT